MKHRIFLLSAVLLFLAGAALAVPNAPAPEAPDIGTASPHGDWSLGGPETVSSAWALDGAMSVDSLGDEASLHAFITIPVPCGCWGCNPSPGPFPWPGPRLPDGPWVVLPFPPTTCPTFPIY